MCVHACDHILESNILPPDLINQIGFLSSFYSSSKCTAVIVAAQGLMAIETPELSPYRYYNMSIRLPVLHCLHCVLCYRY